MFLNEIEDIAAFVARPAPVALAARIDIERRTVVVVERTKAFEGLTDLTQVDVSADDIDDVIGTLYLLSQGSPFVGQRAPVQEWNELEQMKKAYPTRRFSVFTSSSTSAREGSFRFRVRISPTGRQARRLAKRTTA